LPFWNHLAIGRLFEYDFNAGSDGNVIYRCAGKMGIHLNTGVFFQSDYRKVKGLIFLQEPNRAVIDHTIVVNLALTAEYFPFEVVG
jgi:hypothetical protein